MSAFDTRAYLRRRWSRRRVLGAMAAVAAPAVLADARWWEPHRLVVERIELAFPELSPGLEGLRIAQLSDFHRSPVVEQWEIERAVARANALTPDVIVLTGDYVTTGHRYATPCAALSGLRAPLGRYAILGNHDYWSPEAVAAALREVGLTVLRNQAQPVRHGGAELWLVGLDDAWDLILRKASGREARKRES